MITKRGGLLTVLIIVFISASALLLFLESPGLQLLLGVIAVLTLIFGIVVFHHSVWTSARKLEEKIEHLLAKAHDIPLEFLKKEYKILYGHYLKMPLDKKKDHYLKLMQLRKKIEELIQKGKEFETKLTDSVSGTVKEIQEKTTELEKHYKRLPAEHQKKYAQHMIQLKDQVGKGRV
ncbi:hypothetical protein HQ489_00805 [Candidatus Woesearchaeota archaeon]|nr:hypothetical protein [Candidatus Woesearchaeota archaeon]